MMMSGFFLQDDNSRKQNNEDVPASSKGDFGVTYDSQLKKKMRFLKDMVRPQQQPPQRPGVIIDMYGRCTIDQVTIHALHDTQ